MISAIVSCMNRLENLKVSLDSWIGCDFISEIVVVDWSSTQPITANDLTTSNKIKIVRVENQSQFSLAKSLNVGFDFTNPHTKICCKIDCDYILTDPDLFFDIFTSSTFDGVSLTKPIFFTGHWMFDPSLSGFLMLNKEHFCFYNENMNGWGYEDQDLYLRLENNGLKQIIIPALKRYIYHIPHDDSDRVCNYNIKDKRKSENQNKLKHDPLYRRQRRTYNTNVMDNRIIISNYE